MNDLDFHSDLLNLIIYGRRCLNAAEKDPKIEDGLKEAVRKFEEKYEPSAIQKRSAERRKLFEEKYKLKENTCTNQSK